MEKIEKIILRIFFILLLVPTFASAAVLSFVPSQKSPKIGDTFSVAVMSGTSDVSMNAASGEISYDKNILEATKISKTGSIISLWAEEPTIDSLNGHINFEGIILTPGYTGDNGKIFSVTFKVKKTGDAKISFISGSILANDGTGKNILSVMNPIEINVYKNNEPRNNDSASVSTKQPQAQNKETVKEPNELKLDNALDIKSVTHPEDNKWYSNNTPEFSWTLPEGAIEVKTVISKSPDKKPSISYIPAVNEKAIEALSDGKYYFSVIARTANGWGNISRKQINIDSIAPNVFTVKIANENRDRKLPPALIFKTTDSETSITKYEVQIGTGGILVTDAHGSDNPFIVPPQNPGAYVATVTAFDEAGNKRSESVGFIIDAIDTPKILYAPSSVNAGDNSEIRGISFPDSTISFFYKDGENIAVEESTRSDKNGAFTMPVTSKIGSGAYILTVRVTDASGARSNETAPKIISFKPFFASFSFILYTLLAIIVIVSVLIAYFMWKRSEKVLKNTSHSTKSLIRDVEHITERSFEILKEDIVNRHAELRAIKPKKKYIDDEIIFLEEMESNISEAKDIIVSDIQKILDDES